MKGLIQRFEELQADPHNLQFKHWNTPHPKYGSVKSHQDQFRDMQRGLRNRLNDWNTKGCDDPDKPSRLPKDAWHWANRAAPAPKPKSQPNTSTAQSISLSDVLKALAVVGLSVGLAATVLYAVLSPEPATKLAAVGLTRVQIAALLSLLGVGAASTAAA